MLRPLPRAWLTYAVCVASTLVDITDGAGYQTGILLFATVPALGIAALVQAILVARRWQKFRWRALAPFAICVATGLSGPLWFRAGLVGRLLLRFREYNDTADRVCRGEFGDKRQRGSTLAFYFGAVHQEKAPPAGVAPGGDPPAIVAADFGTVSHGFAGHSGYLRACGVSTARVLIESGRVEDGWRAHRRLIGDWYIVGD